MPETSGVKCLFEFNSKFNFKFELWINTLTGEREDFLLVEGINFLSKLALAFLLGRFWGIKTLIFSSERGFLWY